MYFEAVKRDHGVVYFLLNGSSDILRCNLLECRHVIPEQSGEFGGVRQYKRRL